MDEDQSQRSGLVIGVDSVPGVGFRIYKERDGRRDYLTFFGAAADANAEARLLFKPFEAASRLSPAPNRKPPVLKLWTDDE